MRREQPCTLVAGGSSGIGHALIELLLAAGHKVYNLDLKSAGRGTAGCDDRVVDLRDYEVVQAVVREIAGEAGGFSGVAAIAGVAHRTTVAELSPAEFRAQTESNLDIIFNLCRAAMPFLDANSSIVTVSSTSIYGSEEGASVAYAAAKAGIIGLTRSLAMQLAREGIRVNCVVPGAVDTPLLNSLSSATEKRMLRSVIPLGRFADAYEIAEVIHFLLEERARYITGQTIVVDGGLALAYKPFL
jgi:3-oxoacyl-[acyl-carrier protein] reductase